MSTPRTRSTPRARRAPDASAPADASPAPNGSSRVATVAEPAVGGAPRPDLAGLRARIDHVDRTLVTLIARRVRLARQVGARKREAGAAPLDPGREAAVIRQAATLAREAGIDEEVVRGVFWQLVELSRREQMRPAGGAR
jgi:chorismate mutase